MSQTRPRYGPAQQATHAIKEGGGEEEVPLLKSTAAAPQYSSAAAAPQIHAAAALQSKRQERKRCRSPSSSPPWPPGGTRSSSSRRRRAGSARLPAQSSSCPLRRHGNAGAETSASPTLVACDDADEAMAMLEGVDLLVIIRPLLLLSSQLRRHLVRQFGNWEEISPEGIETLCSHLEVPHTDVRILMLAWKMGCEKQGYFTLDEWRTGLKALRADSISKLKKAFPELVQEVTRPTNFMDFYTYSFRYCLTEDKKKCIEIPVACELLNLVLGLQFRPLVDKLINYLKYQNDYKVINMDQWMGFIRFCNEIHFPSLDNYDSDLAWPLILDNFVEWLRENKS